MILKIISKRFMPAIKIKNDGWYFLPLIHEHIFDMITDAEHMFLAGGVKSLYVAVW